MAKQSGYSKQWVSGPLRVTKQIGTDDGLLGSFTLCLYWENPDDGGVLWVDFELFEVVTTNTSGEDPQYHRRGSNSPDFVRDLSAAESAAEGFVKWDGCTQFQIGSVHADHRDDIRKLFAAIETAREECARAMPDADVASEYE